MLKYKLGRVTDIKEIFNPGHSISKSNFSNLLNLNT